MTRVPFAESVRSALVEVWAHKLRSGLTLTGVTLGTAAMVVLMTLMAGVREAVWQGVKGLGFDGVMFVVAQPPQGLAAQKKAHQSRGLALRDRQLLEQEGESLQHVAAVRLAELPVQGGGVTKRVRVYAVTASYAQVHQRTTQQGRFFHQGDEEALRRVAVLGAELASTLFGQENPVGRTIKVGEVPFQVIGVETPLGNRFANSGWTQREMEGVLVPLATFRAYVAGGEGVNLITVRTERKENLALVKAEIERIMRRAHRGIEDFEVENVADEMLRAEKEIRVILRNWTIVLAAIAGISLLVGGVGIYSVLRISLAERMYEIGLRKAIGASDHAILAQVLVESTSLSLLGGLAGLALGVGVTQVASGAFESGLPPSPGGLAFAFAFAVAVGFFSGLWPARQAARLTPVEAMRG
ncbi:MAG: ABC transporter permease [Thermoanaerobaculum sp.]|nr:ABC transporter permease [Thermoanaerobaculum sp.]